MDFEATGSDNRPCLLRSLAIRNLRIAAAALMAERSCNPPDRTAH
ncbi:MAG: hypothetical protein AAFV62_05505 [Pseudomonadota bacterium]